MMLVAENDVCACHFNNILSASGGLRLSALDLAGWGLPSPRTLGFPLQKFLRMQMAAPHFF